MAVIVAVLLILGVGVTSTASLVILHDRLRAQTDDELQTAMAEFTTIPTSDDHGPTDYVSFIFTTAGQRLGVWPALTSLGDGGPDITLPSSLASRETFFQRHSTQPATVDSNKGDGHYRVVFRDAYLPDGTPVYLALALSTRSITTTMHRMIALVATTGGAVVIVGMLIGFIMVRRSLKPLRGVESTAAQIAAGDLTQRVPAAEPGTEVGRLTASLNSMLTQIEAAFAARVASEKRMHQFVSDASHELRTPLAAIRGYGELYRIGALTSEDDVKGAMRRIEDEARRMGGLVSDLLQLTRLDEGRGIQRKLVDIVPIVVDAAADLKALDPSREVTLESHMPEGGADQAGDGEAAGENVPQVWGDPDKLRQVFTNLIGNVYRHTPEGTPAEIVFGVDPEAGVAYGAVRDHGPGIDPAQADRVFERFYRLDASRTRDTGGSGLGLAIVASTVEAMGGRVTLTETEGGGATFTVALPLAVPDAETHRDGTAAPVVAA
jgi:two-component system OmpR family sensor kinase